jgi:hypothetical protein
MPRLTADAWETIRAEREATGESFATLGARHGVSDVAILKRARREGWSDGTDVAEVVRRKVNEKVSGVVSGADPQKKAAAIDAAADETAALVRRHRQEWVQVAGLRQEALAARQADQLGAFQRAKLAKITAEMTAIQQAGERKAWGLDRSDEKPPTPAIAAVQQGIKIVWGTEDSQG